jgi:hypothetical protein
MIELRAVKLPVVTFLLLAYSINECMQKKTQFSNPEKISGSRETHLNTGKICKISFLGDRGLSLVFRAVFSVASSTIRIAQWRRALLFITIKEKNIYSKMATVPSISINSNSINSHVHHFKLVLLGDTAVGKSCLVVRFVRDEYYAMQEPTIGGEFSCVICCVNSYSKTENLAG